MRPLSLRLHSGQFLGPKWGSNSGAEMGVNCCCRNGVKLPKCPITLRCSPPRGVLDVGKRIKHPHWAHFGWRLPRGACQQMYLFLYFQIEVTMLAPHAVSAKLILDPLRVSKIHFRLKKGVASTLRGRATRFPPFHTPWASAAA